MVEENFISNNRAFNYQEFRSDISPKGCEKCQQNCSREKQTQF